MGIPCNKNTMKNSQVLKNFLYVAVVMENIIDEQHWLTRNQHLIKWQYPPDVPYDRYVSVSYFG